MTFSQSPLIHANLHVGKEGYSTLYLKDMLYNTVIILFPEFLTSILLILFEKKLNEEFSLSLTDLFLTAKELQKEPTVYLQDEQNIGSYIYKIRKLIYEACFSKKVFITSQDFIISKKGWGYCIHPKIKVKIYNTSLCNVV